MTVLGGVASKLRSYLLMLRQLGGRAGFVLTVADATMFVARRMRLRRHHRLGRVRLRGYRDPLWFRWFSSDPYVIRQIFAEREYDPIDIAPDPKVIVDCGSNIGCSAVWFLNRYPAAKLICVEPDPGNVEVCRRNVAPWGDAVDLIQGAVWPSNAPLEITNDGDLEWAIRVRPATGDGSRQVAAVTMAELLDRSPTGRIDVLKMDVEGAERDVFSDAGSWLDSVGSIIIELHGGSADTFFAALRPYSYDLITAGELTVCTALQRKSG